MKKLKTLNEANDMALQNGRNIANGNLPRPNGIACPTCGKELYDTEPMFTLTSNPPKKNIHCEGCGYAGYRYC